VTVVERRTQIRQFLRIVVEQDLGLTAEQCKLVEIRDSSASCRTLT